MSRTLQVSAIALALTATLSAPVTAAPPRQAGVLVDAPLAGAPGRTALPGKSRGVRMNKAALGQARMRMNLGFGPDLELVRERVEQLPAGQQTWIGRVAGAPDSEVLLVGSGNAVAGTIRHQGRLYRLTPAGEGVQRIEELSPGDPLPHLPSIVPPMVPDEGGTAVSGEAGASASSGAATIVDLLVAYTPQTVARYGSQSGAEAAITLAVAETNQALLNSQAPVQMRLVATLAVSYSDSGNMNTDLSRLFMSADGYLDEVALARDELGADLVSLVVDSGAYCGLGYQMGVLNPAYEAYGYNVVKTTCLNGYYTLAHELGHNLGLSHDHDNATAGLFPYSFGYQDPVAAFRTVMAYSCTTGCARVGHFSNPNISYNGAATGVPDWADATRALGETVALVAGYRASVMPFPPLAPNDLNALAVNHAQINLSWSDLPDEEGWTLERSGDGLSFAPIATLAADATGYSDTGLAAGTAYTYRLVAFNGAGASAPSNLAWASTAAAPASAPAAPTDLLAAALSGSEIALSWSDQADNESGYEVERSADAGGTWTLVASLAADTQDWGDNSLSSLSTYDYRVRAIGSGGSSTYSNIATATTAAVCNVQGAASLVLASRTTDWTLTNLAGNDLTISAVQVTWPKVQGSLKKLSLGGSAFWSGTISGTSTNLTGGWSSEPARLLGAGATESLRLDFSLSSSKDTQADYRITVQFAEGCSITF